MAFGEAGGGLDRLLAACGNGTVQRAAVTLPLAAEVLIAARLLAAGRRAQARAAPERLTWGGLRCAR